MANWLEWFRASNRWKLLAGGALIGLLCLDWWGALVAVGSAASCLELKDRLWGGKWDWVDWCLTVAGGAIGFGFNAAVRGMV